jgi:spore coat polysaccharide biosynthesis protein SpsF (cytidylyltransferase family)
MRTRKKKKKKITKTVIIATGPERDQKVVHEASRRQHLQDVDGPLATVLDRFFFLIACGLRL